MVSVAYAIVPSGKPGAYHAVKLTGVMAEAVEHLVPGKEKTTQRGYALQRVLRAMQTDCARGKLG